MGNVNIFSIALAAQWNIKRQKSFCFTIRLRKSKHEINNIFFFFLGNEESPCRGWSLLIPFDPCFEAHLGNIRQICGISVIQN